MRLSDCWVRSVTPHGGAVRNPLESKEGVRKNILHRIGTSLFPLALNAPLTLMAEGWIPQKYCSYIFPLHQGMAMGVEGIRAYQLSSSLYEKDRLMAVASLVESAALIALTYVNLNWGLSTMVARDLALEMQDAARFLQERNWSALARSSEKMVLASLYLIATLYAKTLVFGVVYAGAQIASHVYKGVIELRRGDWIEATGQMLGALEQQKRAEHLYTADKIISNMNKFYDRMRANPVFAVS